MLSKVTQRLLLLAFAITPISCGSINSKVVVRDRGAQVIDAADLLGKYPDLRLMDDAAILSAAAYDEPTWHTTRSRPEYCASKDALAFDPIDEGWLEDMTIPGPPEPPTGVRAIPDLRYRVWVKKVDDRNVAILAFRGTQSRSDWFSNLRWVTKVVPRVWDHYEQFAHVARDVFATIKRNHGDDTTIIAVGHSLGGGLAQLAGYSSAGDIKIVYGFDPSVVTYFYGVDKGTRDAARHGQSIYRIFEQGEVLSYVRWIFKRFYPITHQDPRIVQVKFHRLVGGLFSNHSMRRFACAAVPTGTSGDL